MWSICSSIFVLVLGCGALDNEVYCVLHSVWRLLGCIDCIAAECIPSGVPDSTDFQYATWVIWAGRGKLTAKHTVMKWHDSSSRVVATNYILGRIGQNAQTTVVYII